MRRSRARASAVLGVMLVGCALALSGDHEFPEPRPLPGPPDDAPRVIVSMGDSTISGEGAGDYEPGTNGEDGNWCHRSSAALVHQIDLPAIDRTINLACSGAPSAQIALGDVKQYTEISQSQRLAQIASDQRVVAVVVAVGANDDPAFSHVLNACVSAWIGHEPGCGTTVGPDWQRRVDAMVPKVVGALTDIRAVLDTAGYQREDYQLVLQSYAAPIGPGVDEDLRNLSGCPFRTEDLNWVANTAVPVLTNGLRRAADEADFRFLDLSRAADGHEACSSSDPNDEWFRRLAVQWHDISDEERATHALQESFHPNANGHAEFARCLSEFLGNRVPAAACLPGEDGNLHAARSVTAP